ncbi:metallophosphoesterase family protein [Microbacterium sp. MMO-10]|uniref:metallophosphoesterase family protein n=1 Tax=Microbacterium sp. MMO-10 TaxID=3081272 RepID=UPI0030199847
MISRRSLITSTATAGALLAANAAFTAVPAAAVVPAGNGKGNNGNGKGNGGPNGRITSFTVISDIQGDLNDFARALQDIAEINPGSAGMAIAGDITPRGYDFEYAQVSKVLDANPKPSTLAWAIGNHEFYVPKYSDPNTLAQATWPNGATEDSLFKSFYTFAGRNTIYNEQLFGDVPVLMIGTEKYMHYHDATLWDEVWMSDAQFAWLEDRLWYWRGRNRPVMVISHHPLPNTVSGSRNKLYMSDYLQTDRLLGLLGRHPDVFLFTGHTHWDLNLSDWYARRVVAGTGNLDGFNVINTGAIQTGWTDNGAGGESVVPGDFNQGLQVEVGFDRVTIKARDFGRKQWIKQIQIPLSGQWS